MSIIAAIYAAGASETAAGEYLVLGFRLFSYIVIIYSVVILITNLNKVKKEIKKLVIYCLITMFTIVSWVLIANTVAELPIYIYKFPYFPVLYFFINAIGVLFIQRNITYEKNCVDNSTFISTNEIDDIFIKRYGITERELEIVKLIADGFSNPDIGEKLYISPNTVKNHIYNIYKKIGIKNRYELISILSQIQKPE